MVKILVPSPPRAYREIFTNSERVREVVSAMHRENNVSSVRLFSGLVLSDLIDVKDCIRYLGPLPFDGFCRNHNLPQDLTDFFQQIGEYAWENKADYALLERFNFQTGRRNELSAHVTLLLQQ